MDEEIVNYSPLRPLFLPMSTCKLTLDEIQTMVDELSICFLFRCPYWQLSLVEIQPLFMKHRRMLVHQGTQFLHLKKARENFLPWIFMKLNIYEAFFSSEWFHSFQFFIFSLQFLPMCIQFIPLTYITYQCIQFLQLTNISTLFFSSMLPIPIASSIGTSWFLSFQTICSSTR